MLTDERYELMTLADHLPAKRPELTPLEWLAEVPAVAAQVPERDHLRFLVRLLTSLQRAGVDMSEHWDCLLEALILEKV